MRQVVPRPSSLVIEISPPKESMIPLQIERPSPVPTPIGFVVKNGSKIRASASGRHAVAVVVDLDDDALAVRPTRMQIRFSGGRSVGESLKRVGDEVQEHLAEARLVGGGEAARRDTPSRGARGGGSRSTPS